MQPFPPTHSLPISWTLDSAFATDSEVLESFPTGRAMPENAVNNKQVWCFSFILHTSIGSAY